MFFARSGVVAATLLVFQATLSIAAPLSDNTVHQLEKRITCQATEVAINNACVSCASLYKNASTCTRSVPLTCSYGVVNSVRKCAAVNCTSTPGTYLSADGKQCLDCADPNALTCTNTTTTTCAPNYTLVDNECIYGFPYGKFSGYGLIKPFLAQQQPLKPVTPDPVEPEQCARIYTKARVLFFIGTSFNPPSCVGQNGALDQNLAKTVDSTAAVLLKGNCTLLATNPFVTASKAQGACEQVFIGPEQFP
ncbi:BQ2448_5553 [Microbotryum intermedium]|uniref:BQ2448_5553 protein n=1 Tax=Microbotryum intermedium TaxID=269621 RepID=A0A238F1J1_9BASI|nr:BQ2448_5553 [Microbotryum intermedium]